MTYLNIESGNPSDKSLYPPVLDASMTNYGQVPLETVADGGYASYNNVGHGRDNSVDRVVFNKRCGAGFHDIGVKKKTFARLRDFRAGIEGNISELKVSDSNSTLMSDLVSRAKMCSLSPASYMPCHRVSRN
ncbi:MAG: hypothetical protein AB8B63_03380 [Granulosicoccus sp.]